VSVEELLKVGVELRGLLTEIRWDSSGDVNWYALFLLRLRLGMAKKISKAFRKRNDVTPADALNAWLPWNTDEEQMQIDLAAR